MSKAPCPLSTMITAFGSTGPWSAAIVIPARNEAQRIVRCLDAAAVAIRAAQPVATGLIVVVNNSTDATHDHAVVWALTHPEVPLVLVTCLFAPEDANAGAARRVGLDLAAKRVPAHGVLMTTDADSSVRPDWITRNLHELTQADLICGRFVADPAEASTLPEAVARHCTIETDYMSVAIKAAALLDPQPHDPDPPHLTAPGASLAFTRHLYDTVGGMPAIAMSEDRAFAALAEEHDFRLRHSDTVIVETSCRMTGRTGGGMAGALRARAVETDPLADEWLEPAATFILRYRLRGQLRAAWPDPIALQARLADALGFAEAVRLMSPPLPPRLGAFLARIEASSPALARVRLRMSGCRAELPLLQAALAGQHECTAEPELRQRSAG